MQTLTLELPAMYGDHHVNEVRRILLGMSGIKDLYVSSYLRMVELSYDPEQLDPGEVESLLAEAGYREDAGAASVPPPTADASEQREALARRTTLDRSTGRVIGFAQRMPAAQNGPWPCPGLGVVTAKTEEEA